MTRTLACAALFVLAGCGSSSDDDAQGGVTANEARALDDAAQMVEARQLPSEALQPTLPPASAATVKSTTGTEGSD